MEPTRLIMSPEDSEAAWKITTVELSGGPKDGLVVELRGITTMFAVPHYSGSQIVYRDSGRMNNGHRVFVLY